MDGATREIERIAFVAQFTQRLEVVPAVSMSAVEPMRDDGNRVLLLSVVQLVQYTVNFLLPTVNPQLLFVLSQQVQRHGCNAAECQ